MHKLLKSRLPKAILISFLLLLCLVAIKAALSPSHHIGRSHFPSGGIECFDFNKVAFYISTNFRDIKDKDSVPLRNDDLLEIVKENLDSFVGDSSIQKYSQNPELYEFRTYDHIFNALSLSLSDHPFKDQKTLGVFFVVKKEIVADRPAFVVSLGKLGDVDIKYSPVSLVKGLASADVIFIDQPNEEIKQALSKFLKKNSCGKHLFVE